MSRAEERFDEAYGRKEYAYLTDDAFARRIDRARVPSDPIAEHARGEHDARPVFGCFACEIAPEPERVGYEPEDFE